jgi:hypothetical protein
MTSAMAEIMNYHAYHSIRKTTSSPRTTDRCIMSLICDLKEMWG